MDYDHINLLLEKYWMCITSIDEERQQRCFFDNEFVPLELQPYKAWFCSHEAEALAPLNEDFDKRILARIELEKKYKRKQKLLAYCFAFTLLLLLSGVIYFLGFI